MTDGRLTHAMSRNTKPLSIPVRVLIFSASIILFVAVLTPFKIRNTSSWLASFYLQTSRFEFGNVECPWAYRFTEPILAGIMPGDERYNFITLTYFFLFLSTAGVYLLLREFGVGVRFSYLGMLLFAFSYPVRHTMLFPWCVDDFTLCMLIFGILAIARENYWIFSFLLLIGTLNHEHALALIPVFAVQIWDKYGYRKGMPFFLYTVPALVAFGVVRAVVPAIKAGYFQYYFCMENIESCYEYQGGVMNMIQLAYNSFGFLWLAPIFGLVKLRLTSIERSILLLFPLSAAQLVIGCDTARLLSLNLPIMIILAVRSFEKIHWGWSAFLGAAFVFRSLVKFAPRSSFHPLFLLKTPYIILTIVDLLVFLALMLAYSSHRSGKAAGESKA